MAVSFLNREISDLCLGKPALRWIAADATVSDALTALRRSEETHFSVWKCSADDSWVCIGKICAADVICFLCRKENFQDPIKAFEAKVSEVLPKGVSIVRRLDPKSSLLEAIDCILDGAQNLVIPIQNHRSSNSRKKFPNKPSSYCWITPEDVIRFLLNSIGVFSPIPTWTIESLNVIDREIMTVNYHDPASSALDYISRALLEQTSVAVIDDENRIIGEISPFALSCCDETVAAAIATLSACDLMAYIDYGGPPEDLVEMVKMRLVERNFGAMLELIEEMSHSTLSSSSSSCSSEDEFGSVFGSGSSRHLKAGRYFPARSSEAILCNPRSSFVAVMIQALAHRASCVWVVEEDHTLVGAVTFTGMLKVFRSSIAGDHTLERENLLKQ